MHGLGVVPLWDAAQWWGTVQAYGEVKGNGAFHG